MLNIMNELVKAFGLHYEIGFIWVALQTISYPSPSSIRWHWHYDAKIKFLKRTKL